MFWTEERLRLYPRAIFVALCIAFVVVVAGADGAATVGGALGGDYAAFHGAGTLVLEGRADVLYVPEAQAAAQRALHPDEPGRYLYFPYPPFVALPYAGLATLGFVGGYVLHTVAAGCALGAAAMRMRAWLPRLGRYPFAMFVAGLAFYPMFRAVFGGQNTPFVLLIVVLGATWLTQGQAVLGGAVLALLLAKPQWGVPLLVWVVWRHPRAGLGAAATAVGLYALGAAVAGGDWPVAWVQQALWFAAQSDQVDAANTVGLIGWLQALAGPGPGSTTSGVILCGVAAVAAWRVGASKAANPLRWGVVVVAMVVLAPHSLFYDAGLALIALAAWAESIAQTDDQGYRRWGPALAWGVGWLGALGPHLGVQPLLPVLLGIGLATAMEAQRDADRLALQEGVP